MFLSFFLSRRNDKNKTKTTILSEQLQEHHPEGNDEVEEGIKIQEFRASEKEAPCLASHSAHSLPLRRV